MIRRLARLTIAVAALIAMAAPAAAEPPAWLFDQIAQFVLERVDEAPVHVAIPPLSDFVPPGVSPERVQVKLRTRSEPPFTGRVPLTVALAVDGQEVKRGVLTVRVNPGGSEPSGEYARYGGGSPNDSGPPLLVERGSLVELVLERGALRVRAQGKAREAGHLGESIRVLNRDSRREVVGRVGEDGRVHVAF